MPSFQLINFKKHVVKSIQVNFISDIRIYNYKNTIFNNRNKHRNKNKPGGITLNVIQ